MKLSLALRFILLSTLLVIAPSLANSGQDKPSTPGVTQGGTADLAEATRLNLEVVKLFNEGKYEEALRLAKRALTLREAALGMDHDAVQGSLLNLAELYTALKKYGEAQAILERLLKTHEQKAGPEDAGAALFLDKLAFLTYVQGNFKKSEAAYKRALAIREKAFGPNSAEFAASLHALAEFYRFRGKFAEAQPLYERATLLRETLLGRENPEFVKTREHYLCSVYEAGTADRDKRVKEFTAKFGGALLPDKGAVVDAETLNGRAITMPKPAYSAEARRVRAQGIVVIKATINEEGHVVEAADMCNGNPLLVKPSIQAARVSRFAPTMVAGKPVKANGVITYTYVVR